MQINGYKSEVIAKHAKTTSVMAWNQEFRLNRKWCTTPKCHQIRLWLFRVKKGQSQMVIRSHFWKPAIIAFTPLPTAATKIHLFDGGHFWPVVHFGSLLITITRAMDINHSSCISPFHLFKSLLSDYWFIYSMTVS